MQSITVPLQGFLNAIVYGWTREDFLYIMVSSSRQEHSTNNYFSSNYINAGEISDHDESTFFEESEQYLSPGSRSRQDTPVTHSRGPSGTYDYSKLSWHSSTVFVVVVVVVYLGCNFSMQFLFSSAQLSKSSFIHT